MSEIDTLIRRELHWLSDGISDDRELAKRVIKTARRRRLSQYSLLALFTVTVSTISILGYIGVSSLLSNETEQSMIVLPPTFDGSSQIVDQSENSSTSTAQKATVISAYPITWEDSIGDLGAISKPAGIADTIGGLTAKSLKVTWSKCLVGACPTEWSLSVINNTEDLISAAPALMVYVDHSPLISSSRPLTVLPGRTATLVFTFPEFTEITNIGNKATWQWNWFLTAAR